MQAGKTIAARRERATKDSERERARKVIWRRKIVAAFGVMALIFGLGFLLVRAFQEWVKWTQEKAEVIVMEPEVGVEVIDERTGKVTEELSSKMKEYIRNLREELAHAGYNMARVRLPVDKLRELDVEIEGVTGYIKVSTDRNAAVTAEDTARMLKYLNGQEFEYIDVRIERKAYWK